jgi:hypothetical protein
VHHTLRGVAKTVGNSQAVRLLVEQNVYRRGRAMRRTVVRKKSGHELIAIVLIYAFVLVVLAVLWQLLGL